MGASMGQDDVLRDAAWMTSKLQHWHETRRPLNCEPVTVQVLVREMQPHDIKSVMKAASSTDGLLVSRSGQHTSGDKLDES